MFHVALTVLLFGHPAASVCRRRAIDEYNIRLVFDYLDSDGNQELDYMEALVPMFSAYLGENIKSFDTDDDGVDDIEIDEAYAVLSESQANVVMGALDKDKGGSLETYELVIPAELTRVAIWLVKKFPDIDTNGDGSLSVPEVIEFFTAPCKPTHHRHSGKHAFGVRRSHILHARGDALKKLFDLVDGDGSGELSKAEVMSGFTAPFVFQVGPYVDTDSDGEYEKNELDKVFSASMVEAVLGLDKDKSGGVSGRELQIPYDVIKLSQKIAAKFSKMAGDDGELSMDEAKKGLGDSKSGGGSKAGGGGSAPCVTSTEFDKIIEIKIHH